MRMKKAAIHTLGCKVNMYESEAMMELLTHAGYDIVPFEDKADVYIINTCSVTNMADRKSRQMIHKARKTSPDAIIVAAGCYVQEVGKKLIEEGTVDIIIGNNQKSSLIDIIEEYKSNHTVKMHVSDLNDHPEYEDMEHDVQVEHTRAFIKIQDGCNMFCSYCIIPYVRGRSRSRELDDIIREVTRVAEHGYREIVLTGIHISSYGVDKSMEGHRLIDVIESISKVPGVDRIRLGSLEPGIIDDEFMMRISKVPQLCPHFHLSLQSGSDSVLKRMNRHYTTREYAERIELIRKYYLDAAITTDVIVGFPGESEAEFEDTLSFIRRIGFAETHIFPYSVREGTVAATMPGQLTQKDKSERVAAASHIASACKHDFMEHRIGRIEQVLIERIPTTIDGREYLTGYTPEYIRVAIPYDEKYRNRIVSGEINGFFGKDLLSLGRIVDFS